MAKLVIFILASTVILLYSWPSLRNVRSHGFFRFFAFEALMVLILSNVDYWIINPLALNQIISWFLLICSLFLAVEGFYLLHIVGKPKDNFENTTRLVTVGMYHYIRHPLYSSLLLLTWGVFLKNLSLTGILLTAVTSVFLAATANVEESENIEKFGEEYQRYIRSTKRFIPFVY